MKKTPLNDIAEIALKKINSLKASPLLVAVDGRCAAGKTTLADDLRQKLGCAVFRMDDFFLRPQQRTKERLLEAGGNIDHERFKEEILKPIKADQREIVYHSFDCKSMALSEPLRAEAGRITIIEGSYSCHPELWEYYDLHIFLSVDSDEQIKRIITRNGEEKAKDFKEKWIPMEEKYFSTFNIEEKCELKFHT